jgi:putative ABC transport system permease protein
MTHAYRQSARDLIAEAISALLAHRLQTLLSGLGIVFGIATVVTALAIGEGARRSALEEVGSLGIDNVFLRSVPPSVSAGKRIVTAAPALSLDDVDAIAKTLQTNRTAATRIAATQITYGERHAAGVLVGATVSWPDVVCAELAAGRWLTANDEATRRRVAIVGPELARELFGAVDPIDSRVFAAGSWYYIVGRLRARSNTSSNAAIQGLNTDRSIVVPLATMDINLGQGDAVDRVQEIGVRLSGSSDVERASRVIWAVAARRHRGNPAYELVVPRELLRARLEAQRTFDVVLLGIGALALVISGIGIMNIMLASVVERTQEIGLRRAVGAKRLDIVAQFAIEAAAICTVGGVVGVPLGAGLSGLVAAAAGWPVSVSAGAVLLALALAGTVGVAFGVYPARLAAQIDPVDALRAP